MSDLGPRKTEPPIDATSAQLAQWAAGEVSRHEEVCGLRYQRIDDRMDRIESGIKEINDRYKAGVRWVMGIVASLCVVILGAVYTNSQTRAQADESDKRELRARLSLLTAQLSNVQGHGPVVIATPGTQATTIPQASAPTPDPEDLTAAAGGDPRTVQQIEPKDR